MEEPRLDVCVLGPVEVRRNGAQVDIGTPRQRSLLSRLLVDAGRVVSLDRLIDDLWSGEPPAAATATVQAYVSNLRRALEPDRPPRAPARVLVTRPPGYAIEASRVVLDRDRFTLAIDEGRRALDEHRHADAVTAFDRAIDEWRGEPFADIDPELDHVVRPERARLLEMHAAAIEDRLAALVALGRHRHVLGDLERLVSEHPYRERAWELLVLARYRSGQQVDALRAFQDARRALVEHVGVEPGTALVELERRVIAQDPTLVTERPEQVLVEPLPVSRDAADGGDRMERPPALVGRAAASAELAAALDALAAGTGGVTLVTGEAGIGKTHLVDVGLGALDPDRFHVAWGRSVEGDFAPGYWPWTQALTRLADEVDPRAIAAAGGHLRSVLPDLAVRHPADDTTGDDPVAARFAAQRAVARFLERVGDDRPTVVVLDDLHWADGSSLRLLAALVDELVRTRVLVVGTYRPVEGALNTALTDVLAAVARSATGRRIELAGLDRIEVAAHLEAFGVDLDARTAAEVQRRTKGNPFFVTELARAMRSRPDGDVTSLLRDVPHGVTDVVRQRLTRLPDHTVELLQLAAVAGRSSELDVVASASGLTVDDVLDRIEPAIVTSVVELEPDLPGGVRFSHDLVRDAVYSAVPASTRVRLHRRIADALVEHSGEPAAARIARHLWEALPLGTASSVRRWSEVAAHQAAAIGADDEAVASWELALRAHDVVHPDDVAGRYDLLVELANARRRAWDVAGATAAIHLAIGLAEHLDDPHRVAEVAAIPSELALWDWNLPADPPTHLAGALERAVARLDRDEHTRELARACGALGVALRYADPARAVDMSERAVALAEKLDDPLLVARTLANAYQARWWRGRSDELLALADRMLATAESGGLGADVESIALMFRMTNLHETGRIDELAAAVGRARALRGRVRWPEVAAQLDYACGTWAALTGHGDDARELIERAWRTRYQDSTMWGGEWTYALARTGIGDLTSDESADLGLRLAEAARHEPSDMVRPTAIVLLARAGRHDEARALAAGGPRVVESWVWAFSLVQWAEAVVELELPGAERIYAELAPYADGFAVAGTNLCGWGSMHLHLGRLALASGDRRLAVTHLRRSLAVHRTHGFDALATRSAALLAGIGEDPDRHHHGVPAGG